MIALDTNVLVRLITRDDEVQAQRARTLIDECAERDKKAFVSTMVLVEMCWTLARTYGFDRSDITRAVRALSENTTISLESPGAIQVALGTYENGSADFPDCLIVAKATEIGCEATVTFDRRMKALPDVRLL
jgi:predicted nucleic-acid-binding protein